MGMLPWTRNKAFAAGAGDTAAAAPGVKSGLPLASARPRTSGEAATDR